MQHTNPRKNIIEYLKKNLKKGYTLDSLKFALLKQGYSRSLLERAIHDVQIVLAQEAPILKEKPKITHQIIDEHDNPIIIEKSWFDKFFD